MPLWIQVIVEGQGDENAILSLLTRIWQEAEGDYLVPLRPYRQPQGTLLKQEGLQKAVEVAWERLCQRAPPDIARLLLLLMDSEGDCPRDLGPKLLGWARKARSDADICCVLAHPMFETWFAAGAASLAGYNGLPANLATPDDPEGQGLGKTWLKRRLPRKYHEPTDQPKFVSRLDLSMCRQHSPSFDKLYRELARRVPGASEGGANEDQGTDPGPETGENPI